MRTCIFLLCACLIAGCNNAEKKAYKMVSVNVIVDSTAAGTVFTSSEDISAINDSDAYVQGFKLYHFIKLGKKPRSAQQVITWFKVVNEQNDSLAFQMSEEQKNNEIRKIKAYHSKAK